MEHQKRKVLILGPFFLFLHFVSLSHIYRWRQNQTKIRRYKAMAVSKNMLEKNLALEYQDGLDKKGKAIMRKATYK